MENEKTDGPLDDYDLPIFAFLRNWNKRNNSDEIDGNFRLRAFSYLVSEARCPAFYINKIAQRKETTDCFSVSEETNVSQIDVIPKLLH